MTSIALLHGFTGSSRSWDAVRRSLGDGQSVVAPTLLGHSPNTMDLSVESFDREVDRLAAVFAANGQGQHLCGYSLGGRLALGLLARHPGLFARATLVGTHAGLESESDRADRVRDDERWCTLLEQKGIEAFVSEWERLSLFAAQARLDPALQTAQREERLRHSARGLVQSLRITGLGRMPSFWSALPAITIPVTLITGELDAKFSRIAEQMAAILPRARRVVVPNCGHNVVFERPDSIVRELRE